MIQPVATPRNQNEVMHLLSQAQQWHADGDRISVAACDAALSRYFQPHLLSRIASYIPYIHKMETARQALSLKKMDPQLVVRLFALPLPRAQEKMIATAQQVSGLMRDRVAFVADEGDTFSRALLEDHSLFDSRRFQDLCEEGLPREERRQQELDCARRAQQLLPIEDVASVLAESDPNELFRLFRFVGMRQMVYGQLLLPIFSVLREQALSQRLSSAQAQFLLEIAQKEPRLHAGLGVGRDRILLQFTGGSIAASRYLLTMCTDLFDLSKEPELAEINLSGTGYTRETVQLLINWIGRKQLPDIASLTGEALISQIGLLASLIKQEALPEIEKQLIRLVKIEHLSKLTEVAVKLKMPRLLRCCVYCCNDHSQGQLDIQSLPDGQFRLEALGIREIPGYAKQVMALLGHRIQHVKLGRDLRFFSLWENRILRIWQCALYIALPYGFLGGWAYEYHREWRPILETITPTVLSMMGLIVGSFYCLLVAKQIQPVASRAWNFLKDPFERIEEASREGIAEAFNGPGRGLAPWPTPPKHLPPAIAHLAAQPNAVRNLQELDLSDFPALTDTHLRWIIRTFPNLRRLTLSSSLPLSAYSLDKLHELRHLEQLTLLVTGMGMGCLNQLNIQEQFSDRPGFQLHLQIKDFWTPLLRPRFFANLHPTVELHVHMKLTNPRLLNWLAQASSLELGNLWNMSTADCAYIAAHYHRLHTLYLSPLGDSNPQLTAIANCPALRKLHIMDGFRITNPAIIALAQHCHTLQELSLMNCPNLSNVALEQLATLPNLRRLIVGNNQDITDEGVQPLLQKDPRPQLLFIHCNQLSAAVLQQTSQGNFEEDREQIRQLLDSVRQTVTEPLAYQSELPYVQKGLHVLFHTLIKNRLCIDGRMDLPFAVPGLAVLNLPAIQVAIQERLQLRATDAPRPFTIQRSQIRLLAQAAAALESRSALTYTQAYVSPIVKTAKKNLPGEIASRTLIMFCRLFPVTLRDGLRKAIECLEDRSLIDYQSYLRMAFPHLNLTTIDDMLKRLREDLLETSRRHRTRFQTLGQIFPTVAQGVATTAGDIFGDEGWRWDFIRFLDRIATAARESDPHWTDEEKLAVALAGLFELSALVPLLSPAEPAMVAAEVPVDEALLDTDGKDSKSERKQEVL